MKKRILSLLLSLALILSLGHMVFAVGTPPYSQPYTKDISGIRYVRYTEMEDLVTEEFAVSKRTQEIYDVSSVLLAENGSWSAAIRPFRNAIISAGFEETIGLDGYNQIEYYYTQHIGTNTLEMFKILGEEHSRSILNESGLVYIEHNFFTHSDSQNTPPQQPAEPVPDIPSTPKELPLTVSSGSLGKKVSVQVTGGHWLTVQTKRGSSITVSSVQAQGSGTVTVSFSAATGSTIQIWETETEMAFSSQGIPTSKILATATRTL